MMVRIFIISLISILSFPNIVIGQSELLSKRKLKRQKIYNNLEEALMNPDEVYRLMLDGSAPGAVKLDSIPSDIYKLKNLQEIILCNNRIESIPKEFFNLKLLQVIDFSFNPIKELPLYVSHFEYLRVLNMRFCHLSSVPAELFDINTITEIDFFGNRIERFPDNLDVNEDIKYLNLLRNGLPQEDQEKIKKYFPNAGTIKEEKYSAPK